MKNKNNFSELFWVFGATWLVGSLWVMYAGKELSWDYFNHHMYIPFAWDTGRIHTDYFAAGPQSYQNPIGYFPFYWMVKFGLSDWLIGLLTTGLHAINGVVVWLLAKIYWQDGAEDRFYPAIAVAFAVTTPVYLVLLGSSFVDNTSSILVLLTLFLIQNNTYKIPYAMVAAGLCIGLACAVKLSNVYFLIAFLLILIVQKLRAGRSFFEIFTFLCAATAAGIASSAWSMWLLWDRFKNPIFPLYNNIFKSPFFSTEKLISDRFIPKNYSDFLFRFWEMTFVKKSVYFEEVLPDFRPLLFLLFVLFSILLLFFGCKFFKKYILVKKITQQDLDALCFTIIAYFLWLNSSGNARYAVALLILFAVLLVRCISIIFSKKYALIFLGTIFCLQISIYAAVGTFRYTDNPWTGGPYVEVNMPQKLKESPYLHLAVGTFSNAYLTLYMHKDGVWLNPLLSQVPIPVEGVMGAPLREMLLKWEGKTRVLLLIFDVKIEDLAISENVKPLTLEAAKAFALKKNYANFLYRINLEVDWNDCLPVFTKSGESMFKIKADDDKKITSAISYSCAVKKSNYIDMEYAKNLAEANEKYKVIENSCPNLYSPKDYITEVDVPQAERIWIRNYANSDIIVRISSNGQVYAIDIESDKFRQIKFENGKMEKDCSRW